MSKSTLTRRTPPPRTEKSGEPAVLDLGAFTLPKGSFVRATTVGGEALVGTLLSVDHKDGVPFTASVLTTGNYSQTRHVYVGTVEPVV